MMNLNQLSTVDELQVELAFTGFVPDGLKDSLNRETTNVLTNCELWSNTFRSWMNTVRSHPQIKCPGIFKESHLFSMGLNFTDDSSIAKLNDKWRQKNEATDVLSFPAIDQNIIFPSTKFLELGDIIVSVETAFKQARSNDHSILTELRWLASHGFLHLLGWDHPTSIRLDKMLSDQEILIKEN